jgi:uncharacterized protein (TIGR02996 family)
LLARVKEEPSDLELRLVVADWLEEHGNAADLRRAECIRLQVALDQALRQDGLMAAALTRQRCRRDWNAIGYLHIQVRRRLLEVQPALADLEERIAELQTAHGKGWAGALGPKARQVEWDGGLMRVCLAARDLTTRLASIVADSELAGWLLGLQLRSLRGPHLARIARCELLGHLVELDLSSNSITADGAATLLSSPHLGGLARLDLSHDPRIGQGGLEVLAAAGHLRGLRELKLACTFPTAEGVAALAAAPHLARLEHLNLHGNRNPLAIGAEGARALADSSHLGRLAGFSLAYNDIGPAGLEALLSWPGLDALRFLDLSGNRLSVAEAVALAECPRLARLTALGLSANDIGDAGVLALARSPYLKGLCILELGDNHIGPAGGAALLAREHFPALGALIAYQNDFGEEVADALGASFVGFQAV